MEKRKPRLFWSWNIMRYFNLYIYFIKFAFSKAMEFRVDFFFRVLMDLVFYIIQFGFFNILYLHTDILGGWNLEQMKIFIASFIFVDAFNMTFFANNSWQLPISINKGELDYYLTKPIASFFVLGLREIAANSFINLIFATCLLIFILVQSSLSFSLISISIFILLLINGAFLYYMTFLVFLLPVFWSGSSRGFADVFFAAEKIFQRPDGIFTYYIRRFFLFILPFSAMASMPTRYLFEENKLIIFTQILGASLFIYALVWFIWSKALKNYTSASS